MAATNINRVIVTGNLTRDPELRSTPGGTSVCSLRIAVNSRRKERRTSGSTSPTTSTSPSGAQQGENCAQYLAKGRPVAVDGRLNWREWEAQDGGKRQSVDIIADSVQFLGSREVARGQPNGAPESDLQADTSDFERRGGRWQARTTTSRSSRTGSTRTRAIATADLTRQVNQHWQREATTRAPRTPSLSAGGRRKSCHFCRDKVDHIDYKDFQSLRRYLSDRGKIRSRRITGACRRHQNQLAERRQARSRAGAPALRQRSANDGRRRSCSRTSTASARQAPSSTSRPATCATTSPPRSSRSPRRAASIAAAQRRLEQAESAAREQEERSRETPRCCPRPCSRSPTRRARTAACSAPSPQGDRRRR